MKKLSTLMILITATALALSACSTPVPQPTVAPSASPKGMVLIAEGRLQPVNVLDQSFSVPGQVAEVLVKDGDAVKVGQVLARLNPSPDGQAALARAEQEALAARLALEGLKSSAEVNLAQAQLAVFGAKKALDKAQELYDEEKNDENKAQLESAQAKLNQAEKTLSTLRFGNGIDPDVEAAAEARLKTARAVLASAQAALDALELKSSTTGTVVDPTVQVGQRVAAGQSIFTVADFSQWVVKTDNLTELQVVNLKIGQKVEVTLDALPEVVLGGEVSQINRRFEEKRGDITYTVTVILSQSQAGLRWGMTAAVKFLP